MAQCAKNFINEIKLQKSCVNALFISHCSFWMAKSIFPAALCTKNGSSLKAKNL